MTQTTDPPSRIERLTADMAVERERIEATRQEIRAVRRDPNVDTDQFTILLNRLELSANTMGQLIERRDQLKRENAS